MPDDGYNGWSNWETWTCSLWIANDEPLYNIGRDCESYQDFIDAVNTDANGDGVSWDDPAVDTVEMDAFIVELS
mgnify:CR=1 FL=1